MEQKEDVHIDIYLILANEIFAYFVPVQINRLGLKEGWGAQPRRHFPGFRVLSLKPRSH